MCAFPSLPIGFLSHCGWGLLPQLPPSFLIFQLLLASIFLWKKDFYLCLHQTLLNRLSGGLTSHLLIMIISFSLLKPRNLAWLVRTLLPDSLKLLKWSILGRSLFVRWLRADKENQAVWRRDHDGESPGFVQVTQTKPPRPAKARYYVLDWEVCRRA